MRIHIELILVIALLASCSCRPSFEKEKVEADIQVSIVPEKDTVLLSSIYNKGYDILAFDSITLASINKLLRYDSLWIVKGKSPEGGVHLFTEDGHYLKTLLGWGQGPTEVFDIWAMKLYKDAVLLLVNAGSEVIKYSFVEQRVKLRFRLPDEVASATDFEVLPDGRFVFLKSVARKTEKEYSLYVYNLRNQQIERRFLELDKPSSDYISFSQTDCLYRTDGTVRYYEVFRNGISQIVGGDLEGYIAFTDNQYSFPEDELYKDSYTFDSFLHTCENSSYIWAHRNLYEGKRFIISSYIYRKEEYWNVIDKLNNRSHSYRWVKDDLLLNATFSVDEFLFLMNVQDGCHYFTLSNYDVVRMLQQSNGKNSMMDKIPNLRRILDDDSNDLVFCLYEN